MRDLAAQPRGLVRVTTSVALGRQHIAPHIEGFIRANPGIRIELDVSDRLVTLAHEGFDLAIRHTSNPPENHVAWKLCDSRSLLVASPGYLREHGTPKTPAAVAGLGLALLPDFSATAALRSGRLKEVLPAWRPGGFFGDAIHAIRPWSARTPKPVQALVAHLRAGLKEGFEVAGR